MLISENYRKKIREARNPNEDVMRRLYGIKRPINCAPVMVEGITINRIIDKHGKKGFVIISANSSRRSQEENDEATRSLISDIKERDYSYLPVYGGYHSNESGEDDTLEPSFLVFNYISSHIPEKDNPNGIVHNKGDFEDLKEFAIKMCRKYNQDCVLINEPGEAPNYYDCDGNKVNKSSSKDIIKNDGEQTFYTTLNSKEKEEYLEKHKLPKSRRFTMDINFNESKYYVNPFPLQITEQLRRKGEIFIFTD